MVESAQISNSDIDQSIDDIGEQYRYRDLKILVRRRLILQGDATVSLGGSPFISFDVLSASSLALLETETDRATC